MCLSKTRLVDRNSGLLYVLCPQAVDHLLDAVGVAHDSQPARAVFETFCNSPANIVIFEFDYYDLDFRSEFAKTYEHAFSSGIDSTLRVHFFAAPTPSKNQYLWDFVNKFQSTDHYCGYTIIRPQYPGVIGRTMVTPKINAPKSIDLIYLDGRIRTAVTEHLQVFGVNTAITGVPFMEQDGYLLRCAHISAWICHYTAVLSGITGRMPTAQFHDAGDTIQPFAEGRPYPSMGLTTLALSAMLRAIDLPAEVLDFGRLRMARPLTWADSPDLRDRLSKVAETPGGADDIWVRENLTDELCRYMNSGIPSILAHDYYVDGTSDVNHAETWEPHTQTVVGYLRRKHLKGPGPEKASVKIAGESPSTVVQLIVSDDVRGPFEFLDVDDLVSEICASQLSIVVPQPSGIVVSALSAETEAARLFMVLSREWATHPAVGATSERLKNFVEGTSEQCADTYRMRTYATTGVDFKQSFASRFKEVDAIRALSVLQLPKYVWVIEALVASDGGEDHDGHPVCGTVVINASNAAYDTRNPVHHAVGGELNRPRQMPVRPLFIQFPGFYWVATDSGVSDVETWRLTADKFYASGRWSFERAVNVNADWIAIRTKSATN